MDFNNNRYLSDGEQKTIISEVEKDISNALSPVFSDDISEYIKDLLADKAPSSDIEKEKLEYEAKQEEKATEVESAKMDVMFSEPKINEPIELSNGTSVKLEYDLASHNDWVEIIKFLVMEDLPNLMPDELKKKLSFMVTTANRELNKGKTIKGLNTKEAIKIRKTKNL